MSRFQDQSMKESLRGSMDTNQGVQLPFVAPMMWWKNGEAALRSTKEIKDARRFGGWGISEEEIANASLELPSAFQLFEMSGDNGLYNAYLARWSYLAPIARRFAWFQKPDGNWTSKLNILAYMAEMKQDKSIVPWGPVVLTAKGYSGKYIDDAVKKFSVSTAKLRDGDPANFFYHPLGTFAAEPVAEKITGKGGSSSPITPCQLFIPTEGYSTDDMDKYFVGEEVAAVMTDLYDQSREWLDDWNNKKKVAQQEQTDPNEIMDAINANPDEFPF